MQRVVAFQNAARALIQCLVLLSLHLHALKMRLLLAAQTLDKVMILSLCLAEVRADAVEDIWIVDVDAVRGYTLAKSSAGSLRSSATGSTCDHLPLPLELLLLLKVIELHVLLLLVNLGRQLLESGHHGLRGSKQAVVVLGDPGQCWVSSEYWAAKKKALPELESWVLHLLELLTEQPQYVLDELFLSSLMRAPKRHTILFQLHH